MPQPKPGALWWRSSLYLCRLDCPLDEREIAIGDEPTPWMAIKLYIRAVGSRKDTGNDPGAAFAEITVFADCANAIAHLKAVR
jgi:hypothetical protein